jgi:hypothetical protein
LAKKLAFFSKTNIMIKILHNLALFGVKKRNFFAIFFGENIFKIVTSTPGRLRTPVWRGRVVEQAAAGVRGVDQELLLRAPVQAARLLLLLRQGGLGDALPPVLRYEQVWISWIEEMYKVLPKLKRQKSNRGFWATFSTKKVMHKFWDK